MRATQYQPSLADHIAPIVGWQVLHFTMARSHRTRVAACILALCAAAPALAQTDRPTPAQVRRDLDAARARWKANPVRYYRLRVSTTNALLSTVRESDVRNGAVLVARQSSGMPGVDEPPGTNWGPFDGQTVEALFQLIEFALNQPGEKVGDRLLPNIVLAKYDARGNPTSIYSGPPAEAQMMDADVSYTVELIESPATPLVVPSPGEAYKSPVPARLVKPGRVYSTPFGFGSNEIARGVRRVWPKLAGEIISRGAEPYWSSVGWTPRTGLTGVVIGTITMPSGVSTYVMEFQHNGRSLYLLVERSGVLTGK